MVACVFGSACALCGDELPPSTIRDLPPNHTLSPPRSRPQHAAVATTIQGETYYREPEILLTNSRRSCTFALTTSTREIHRTYTRIPALQRALVFDYLCHSSYTHTARAFLKDTTVKQPDSDADNSMAVDVDVDDRHASHATKPEIEDRLRSAELRRGM